MNANALVSVIIPTFKSGKYLEESITSIINQSYRNIEVIIIDDTPTDDGTRKIISTFGDDRIRYYKPVRRLGLAKSLNFAIKNSNGKYIARMDADDISHRDRIKVQVEYMEHNSETGVLGCNCYTIDEKGNITGSIIHPCDNTDIKIKMIFNAAFVHPSVMIRKELLDEELYNENCYCCEDYELWSRLMNKTEFHNLPQKLIKYRILSGGAMQSQLSRLQTDDEYYMKHSAILKLAYDNVLAYYGVEGIAISDRYVDLTFAKRISNFTLSEREEFLLKYEEIIRTKYSSKYINKCISYQWIKMSKSDFCKTKRLKLICGGINQLFFWVFEKTKAIGGFVLNRNNPYEW